MRAVFREFFFYILFLFVVACTKGTPEVTSLSSLAKGIEVDSAELSSEHICFKTGQSKTIKIKCHDLRVVKVQYAISDQEPTEWTSVEDGSGNFATCASGELSLILPPSIITQNKSLYLKGQTENAEVPQIKYSLADPNQNPIQILNNNSSIAAGATLQLDVQGGSSPYTFKVISGKGSVDLQGLYSSPEVSGSQIEKVEISDSLCAEPVVAEIQVIGDFGVILSGTPTNLNRDNGLNISVNLVATQMQPISGNYKYSLTVDRDCSESDYQSAPQRPSGVKITDTLNADGEYYLCVWGQKSNQEWQSFGEATKAKWTRDVTPPVLTINQPSSTYLNQQNLANYNLSGSCSESGQKVALSISSSTEDILCLSGAWSVFKDFSTYQDGNIVISVSQIDLIGNTANSNPLTLAKDSLAPTVPSGINDGTFSISLNSSPSIQFTAPIENSTALTVQGQVVLSTDWSVVKTWSTVSSGQVLSNLNLQESKTYKLQLRAVDLAGNTSSIVTSDGWLVDSLGPTLGISFVDGDYSYVLSESPTMTWSAATDSGSGLAQYEIGIGTTVGSTDVLPFTSLAKVLTGKITGLSLTKNATYFSTLRAKDNAGNYSGTRNGDGWVALGDPCEGVAEGGVCTGGGVYVGTLNGKKYMVTPGGCTDSATPVCDGSMDTVKRTYTESTPTREISEVEIISASAQKNADIVGSSYKQYGGYPSYYMSSYGGPDFGGYQLASGWCYGMTYGNFSDWFLPNKTEMAFLYCKSIVGSHGTSYPQESPNCTEYGGKKNLIGGFAGGNYWAATQASITGARIQSFVSGSQSSIAKTNTTFLRCMRSY